MAKVTWVNPAEEPLKTSTDGWDILVHVGTDHHRNHVRRWSAERAYGFENKLTERVAVSSGSGGISLRVNDSYMYLPKAVAEAVAMELLSAHSYSARAKAKFRAYWRARNSE